MSYRRVLLLAEAGEDVSGEAAAIRRIAPHAERLLVVARLPAARFPWLTGPAPEELTRAATASLEKLRADVSALAASIEVVLAPEFDADHLTRLANDERIDLVVTDLTPIGDAAPIVELRRRREVALLWAASEPARSEEIVCVAAGRRAATAVACFLRDHAEPSQRITVLMAETPAGELLAAAIETAGIEAKFQVVEAGTSTLHAVASGEQPAALVVVSYIPTRLLFGGPAPAPVLVLPPLALPSTTFVRAIDVPDLVDQSGTVRLRVDYAAGPGRNASIPDQEIALVARGKIAAVVRTVSGRAELPADTINSSALGIFRIAERAAADPLAAIEILIALVGVRPQPKRSVVLFDAELEDAGLPAIATLEADAIAVRMRPMESCQALRGRLRAVGIGAPVVDASAVLDEGDAFDVPDAADPVRLARVAVRMRADGFPVAAIVYRGPHAPLTIGFAALTADQLEGASWLVPSIAKQAPSLGSRLDATTGAPLLGGNRVELELDNATARRWLLEVIDAGRDRIHLQVYAVSDDEVGRAIEEALARAAARGVRVRMLVDPLHTLHGVFGMSNPLLDRVAANPGIELRVSGSLDGVPSVEELKQRDHKKLVVVDGAIALIGGRNVAHEYYTGFDEISLDEHSDWSHVPWLDGGARVEGPAVSAIEEAFREAWTGAGGESFDIRPPAPCGPTAARVVVHHGLRDARTLDTYLALIDSATSHVYAVNGFPLILEIQHALLRALGRGVRVRTLFGHVTPTHDGQPFGGTGSTARLAATELVHSRMDALVAAGGEAYPLAVPLQPRWSASLGIVRPHVHAKVVSIDGRACAIGSANLDITAGYWESELLLVVEDEAAARALEARIDSLIAHSSRIDRDDPEWQQLAKRREWMRHWPGILSL